MQLKEENNETAGRILEEVLINEENASRGHLHEGNHPVEGRSGISGHQPENLAAVQGQAVNSVLASRAENMGTAFGLGCFFKTRFINAKNTERW